MASQVLQPQQFNRTSNNQSSLSIMTDQKQQQQHQSASSTSYLASTTTTPPLSTGHDLQEADDESQTGGIDCSASQGQKSVEGELGEEQTNSDDPNKHHVGPVMGIFFKVWSLVKVTKVRHNQHKMRRQNSEDTGHFQYISGDQLMGPSGPNGANNSRRPLQVLQDGHFRRAGSQPAPSCSGGGGPELPTRPATATTTAAYQRLLQVGSSSTPTTTSTAANTTTTATTTTSAGHLTGNLTPQQSNTNSTSSGVSSCTTSSFRAAVESSRPVSMQASSSPRRSSRKTRSKEAAGKQVSRQSAEQRTNQRTEPEQELEEAHAAAGSANKTSTWTSKIKRSATTVNQTDLGSYVSRYRFRRPAANSGGGEQHNKRSYDTKFAPVQSQLNCSKKKVAPSPPQVTSWSAAATAAANQTNRQARVQSEAVRTDDLQKRRPRPRLWSRDAISVDDDGDEELADQIQDNNDDSDLNDIYSTPNDSIHSVPNSAHLGATQPATSCYFGAGDLSDGSNVNVSHINNKNQSIIKSFSTNNFSQLIKQDNNNRNLQFDTIQEHQFQKLEASKNNSHQPKSNQTNLLLPTNTDENKTNSASSSKRLSGSRFFISSSSSEESNPPSGQNKQTNHQQQHLQANKQQYMNIPVNVGLHYHQEPSNRYNNNQVLLPIRPDSLQVAMGTKTQVASNFVDLPQLAGGLVTPTFLQLTCPPESVSIATMSPAAVNPPSVVLPASQAVRLASSNGGGGYKKSSSSFEISAHNHKTTISNPIIARFSSKFPSQQQHLPPLTSTFQGQQNQQPIRLNRNGTNALNNVPNSISLHDCKLSTPTTANNSIAQTSQAKFISQQDRRQKQLELSTGSDEINNNDHELVSIKTSEYKLAQMLLELGSNSNAKDEMGCTALMHAVLSDNLPALRCLIEHGVDLDDTNLAGLSALDMICARRPTELRLEMLKLLIENRADMDKTRPSDGTRLLDRLIGEHGHFFADKLAYIDCLLHNGAKLGSSTWAAASGKHEIQLRLLKKLCQDGYFLYKKCSIESAVYRFEYALKRIAELEQQLASACCVGSAGGQLNLDKSTLRATQQIKYQTYLGLSRCERKRKFFKRALEFAHMSILIDSTAYEGHYSRAHILKDLGELDESLAVIEQTSKLVERSIEMIKTELKDLKQQEEAIIFDGCFDMRDPNRVRWIDDTHSELTGNLDYLEEAKRHIARLREEISHDKSVSAVI